MLEFSFNFIFQIFCYHRCFGTILPHLDAPFVSAPHWTWDQEKLLIMLPSLFVYIGQSK